MPGNSTNTITTILSSASAPVVSLPFKNNLISPRISLESFEYERITQKTPGPLVTIPADKIKKIIANHYKLVVDQHEFDLMREYKNSILRTEIKIIWLKCHKELVEILVKNFKNNLKALPENDINLDQIFKTYHKVMFKYFIDCAQENDEDQAYTSDNYQLEKLPEIMTLNINRAEYSKILGYIDELAESRKKALESLKDIESTNIGYIKFELFFEKISKKFKYFKDSADLAKCLSKKLKTDPQLQSLMLAAKDGKSIYLSEAVLLKIEEIKKKSFLNTKSYITSQLVKILEIIINNPLQYVFKSDSIESNSHMLSESYSLHFNETSSTSVSSSFLPHMLASNKGEDKSPEEEESANSFSKNNASAHEKSLSTFSTPTTATNSIVKNNIIFFENLSKDNSFSDLPRQQSAYLFPRYKGSTIITSLTP